MYGDPHLHHDISHKAQCYHCDDEGNHSKNVDDEELPEQLILDDQQNGLHNQQDEQDWRQDGDNPVRVPTGASDILDSSISCGGET